MSLRHGTIAPATALIVALSALAAPLAAQSDYETTRVADGVYQFRWQNHNGMFVTTPAGVVAFDPIGVDAARQFAREIQSTAPGAALVAIVYSHSDADHATAYDLCAPDLQAEFDGAEDLGAWMQDNGIVPLEWTFESENVIESMVQLLGTASFAGDIEAGFEVVVIEVDGELLVAGFHAG